MTVHVPLSSLLTARDRLVLKVWSVAAFTAEYPNSRILLALAAIPWTTRPNSLQLPADIASLHLAMSCWILASEETKISGKSQCDILVSLIETQMVYIFDYPTFLSQKTPRDYR